jgi:hypothetical protein
MEISKHAQIDLIVNYKNTFLLDIGFWHFIKTRTTSAFELDTKIISSIFLTNFFEDFSISMKTYSHIFSGS